MKNRRTAVIALIVLVGVLVGGYYGVRAMSGGANGALKASGTIEATTVNVSPELAGKVQQVLVQEGQSVQAGQVLLRLDDTLLRAQRAAAAAGLAAAQTAAQTAQAGLASAQAQYTLAQTQARAQGRATRLADWTGKTPDYFNQPKWYFTQEEQLASAQAEVAAAQAGMTAAEGQLEQVVGEVQNSEFVAAEQRLAQARQAYLVALQVQAEGQAVGAGLSPDQLDLNAMKIQIPCFETPKGQVCAPGYRVRSAIARNLPDQVQLNDAAQRAYDAASAELSAAQAGYDGLLSTGQAQAVLKARAGLAVANERYQVAQERLSGLQTGDESPQVALAAAGLAQAKNAAQQAQDGVGQAQANLELLDAQLGKLEVRSPLAGVVLTRNVEPGEYVAPGGTALTVGQLSELTITVYVPEDRYGQIHLGQGAAVSVDSFPEDTFAGQVSYISDQAEFTPRNVQTVEGRSSTVYAIKLTVADPGGQLKPGMPADVTFGN
jgi:HlyD family secretion protein